MSSPDTAFDPAYEFEAPQFRDFTKQTPESERALQESWFDTSRQLDLETSFDTTTFDVEDIQVEVQAETPAPQVEEPEATKVELQAETPASQVEEAELVQAELQIMTPAPQVETLEPTQAEEQAEMPAPQVEESEQPLVEEAQEPVVVSVDELGADKEIEMPVEESESPVIAAVHEAEAVDETETPVEDVVPCVEAMPEPTTATSEPTPDVVEPVQPVEAEPMPEQKALPAFESKIFEQKSMTSQDNNKRKRIKSQAITAAVKSRGATKASTSKRTKIDADKYSVFSMTTRSMKGKRANKKEAASKTEASKVTKPAAKRAKLTLTKPQGPVLAISRTKRQENREDMKPGEALAVGKPRRGSKKLGGVTKLTEPEPFTFATDARAKRHTPTEVGEEFVSFNSQSGSFSKGLRSDTPVVSASLRLGPTKPKTFNFTRSKRSKEILTTEERELEEISEYNRQHAKSGSRVDFGRLASAKIGNNKIQSTEDQELALIKAQPTYKAQPVRKFTNITKSLASTRKELTVPQGYNLSTSNRVKEAEVAVEAYKFKPLPFNRAIFEAAPQAAKVARDLTMPMSPGLSKGNRKRKAADEPSNEFTVFKARPMPDYSANSEAQAPVRPLTDPAPFNLATEDRGADKAERLRQQLQQEAVRAKQQADFVARSLPNSTRNPQPLMLDAPRLTQPEPFNLQSSVLSEQARAVFQERIADDKENARRARDFKAKEATVLTKRAFQTRPANQMMLTEPAPFDLKSSLRAEDRSEYDTEKNGRITEREDENTRRKSEAQEKEVQDVAILRKSLVHKPLALRSSTEFILHPSTKALTKPSSPQLQTSVRSSARMMR
jgi:hypothetical protein